MNLVLPQIFYVVLTSFLLLLGLYTTVPVVVVFGLPSSVLVLSAARLYMFPSL